MLVEVVSEMNEHLCKGNSLAIIICMKVEFVGRVSKAHSIAGASVACVTLTMVLLFTQFKMNIKIKKKNRLSNCDRRF